MGDLLGVEGSRLMRLAKEVALGPSGLAGDMLTLSAFACVFSVCFGAAGRAGVDDEVCSAEFSVAHAAGLAGLDDEARSTRDCCRRLGLLATR